MLADVVAPESDRLGGCLRDLANPLSIGRSDPRTCGNAAGDLTVMGAFAVSGQAVRAGQIGATTTQRAVTAVAPDLDSADIVSRTAQFHASQGVDYLLDSMSIRQQAAYLADPARGSRFLGTSVHELTADSLNLGLDSRFIYRRQGSDFVDTLTGELIELTTPGSVAAHQRRAGYQNVSYALYDLPGPQ